MVSGRLEGFLFMEVPMLIRRVCAWCGRTIGFKEITSEEGKELITHTICPDCKKKVETQIQSFSRSLPNNDESE